MKIKKCLCGSNRILDLTFVKCLDCGRQTKNYQCTAGETQIENAAALDDWNNRRLLTFNEVDAI
jgi:hypothetical protein